MSNKFNIKELDGLFIYHDEKNRTIYSNPFQKDGYILTNSDYKAYIVYSARWLIAISVPALLYYFVELSIPMFILIALAIYAIGSALFYFKFLPSLPIVKNFKKPKRDNLFIRNSDKLSTLRLLSVFIIGILAAVLLIINLRMSNFDKLTLYANYLVIAFVILYSIFDLIQLIKRVSRSDKSLIQMIKEEMKKPR